MRLTKYEVARIIGARANQLANGAPPLIKLKGSETFIEVARMEMEKKVIPLAVVRNNE